MVSTKRINSAISKLQKNVFDEDRCSLWLKNNYQSMANTLVYGDSHLVWKNNIISWYATWHIQ